MMAVFAPSLSAGPRPGRLVLWAASAVVGVSLLFPALAGAEPVTGAAESLRTAWYPDEPALSPQLLESGGFGRVFAATLQGQVYAQPLVSGNTLFAATEDNWIYGIDPRSGEIQWERNVGTPWNAADLGCTDLAPHIGITGTPVIDPSTNTAYFLAKGYASGSSGPAVWKMYAVDLANGAERPGFPVTISGEAQNLPGLSFEPTHQLQRPALLLMNGVVYAAFGGICDLAPFQGWIFGVSTSGQIETRWATTSEAGASIWQSGGGLISDGEGQLLFATGNSWSPPPGPGTSPPEGHLGDSVVRAEVEPDGTLVAKDFFSPYNNVELDLEDLDLGSGAPLALPSPYFGTADHPHLLVQVGKAGTVYLLDRDNLGGMGQGSESKNVDLGEIQLPNGVWGSLATWPGDGGYVYVPAEGEDTGTGALEFLRYGIGGGGEPELTSAAGAPGLEFGSGSPIVTSNGTASGSAIVWVSACSSSPECEGSTLDAYAAVPFEGAAKLLWSGDIGVSTKFARPEAADGRIYVGTREGRLLGFGTTHHALTVSSEGGGSVSSGPEGIDCGSACEHAFADGTAVTLTAIPAAHHEFSGWSGGGCSGAGPCQLKMYADATVGAKFTQITHELTVAKVGSDQGTVTSAPAGIDCGVTCGARFDEGGSVVLEAAPNAGATVTWSGCASTSGDRCRVEDLEADREVSVAFGSPPAPPPLPLPREVSVAFGSPPAPPPLPLPQTTLTRAKIDVARRSASFRFSGSTSTSSFQCRLIRLKPGRRRARKPAFRSCGQPKSFRGLRSGRYLFEVRAVNATGVDPSPARRRFRI